MKEGKGKTDKPAEPSLESILDAVETRVEALVEVVRNLTAENARLKTDLSAAQSGGEAAILLAKYEDERNTVRERIERVLRTLEDRAGAQKT